MSAGGLQVDRRSDVFAVGIVLWELLAARRLFLGETDYQTVELVRAARFAPIEGLDPELDAIARKALARDASDRYQTATELADALAQYAVTRRLSVSAVETAPVVRDVRAAIARQRSREPMDAETYARIQSDLRRMTSVVFDDASGSPNGWN
jgi:serine/threonine-protein kinase